MDQVTSLPIASQADLGLAQRRVRALALEQGFGRKDAAVLALVATELGTNLLRYARGGRLRFERRFGPRRTGIVIESLDEGPGIVDPVRAMQDGYSTGGGLGGGLPAVRRLMDEFSMQTGPAGTRILACKWTTKES